MTFATRTITTRNATIHVAESGGTGMPLLMLHGSGASGRVFAPQMQSALADRYRMIVPDLPGHGDSSNAADIGTGQSYTLPGLAATIGDVVAQLGVERLVIFGWSLGGHIALELMASHPAVAGVMLMGAPPIGRGPVALLRAFRTNLDTTLASKAKFSAHDIARFGQLCFGAGLTDADLASITRADGQLRRIMFSSMMGGRCVDEKALVETSPVPVAVVNGSDDPFVRPGYVAGLRYRTLWNGMCHVIPDASHAAFRDAPEVFNALLMRFADDVASGSRGHAAQTVSDAMMMAMPARKRA